MNMKFFGYTFGNAVDREVIKTIEPRTITDPDALNITGAMGSAGVLEYSANARVPAEVSERIRQYRTLSQTPEISQITTEIFNEVFITDVENRRAFDISFYDDSDIGEDVRLKIADEVEELYNIAKFRQYGADWFADWFIDSRFTLQIAIDEDNPENGIRRLFPIDPLQLMRVQVIPNQEVDGTWDVNSTESFWVYNRNSFDSSLRYDQINMIAAGSNIDGINNGTRITDESIVQVNSGIRDPDNGRTIGYLNKLIVPYNNLKMMEEAMIIFRVARAPMRRAFYFDVSRLPPGRGEEYLEQQMKRFKTRFVYNSKTGTSNSQTHISSILEDYFIPRASEGRTTEIQNIEGQSVQEILEELEYLKNKLLRASNVPNSRLNPDQQGTFNFGRGATEIQMDEYRFKKFLNRIRGQFMTLFDELLRRQLILKNIIKEDEWEDIYGQYFWQYTEDNAFVEWKEAEKLNSRIEQLERITAFSDTYFSEYYIKKNVLHQTDEEIDEIQKQIAAQPPRDEDSKY